MGEIVPEEQFLPFSTIFYNLMLDFYVKTGIRFSLRDKRLFEMTEVEITRVDCICTFTKLSAKDALSEKILFIKVGNFAWNITLEYYTTTPKDLI